MMDHTQPLQLGYVITHTSSMYQLRAKGHNQVSHTPMGGQKETVDQKSNQTAPNQTEVSVFTVFGWWLFFIFIKFSVSFVTRFLFSVNR